MDALLWQTYAALGALFISIINLGLLVYKEYPRKPKLNTIIKNSDVRQVEEGLFDIQIDIELKSLHGDVYIKGISFIASNDVFDPIKGINKKSAFKIIDYPGYSLLDGNIDDFKKKTVSFFKKSKYVSNLKISKNEHKTLSIIDRIENVRYMDGYWDWPRSGWVLEVETSSNTHRLPFSFIKHKSSKGHSFCN